MGQSLYSNLGYQLFDGASSGERAAGGDATIAATTGFTESVSLAGASNISITISGTAGSTGTVEVRYSPVKDFATGVVVGGSLTFDATHGGLIFQDAGPWSGFVRVYNLSNNGLGAYFQAYVGE